MRFLKYEFDSVESWKTIKSTLVDNQGNPIDSSIVELGFLIANPTIIGEHGEEISPAIVSNKYSVDILWNNDKNVSLEPYEVYPESCGLHTFSGLEYLYNQEYNSKFSE